MNDILTLKSCPKAKDGKIEINFDGTSLLLNLPSNESIRYSHDEIEDVKVLKKELSSYWMNGNTLAQSEAVCVKLENGMSRCNNRTIVPEEILDISGSNFSSRNNDHQRPNVLSLLLDPISRHHFNRIMPQPVAFLNELNFVGSDRYTAVGPNSGPNQAALYSGIPLGKRIELHKEFHGGDDKWLWDRLRAAGYVTLKGEDSCILNLNTMQILRPNTTHGNALQGLFCFDDFSRPNCRGPALASSLLFRYGDQFFQLMKV
jgi:hypothetical protein